MNNVPMGNTAGTDPLAELRDIHLPDAIGWWPLAPGWWMLLALLLIVIATLFFYLRWRDIQKNRPVIFSTQQVMQAALHELSVIEQAYATHDTPSDQAARESVADISQLLRRSAVQLGRLNNEPNAIAGLTGDAWLNWLDGRWDRDDFIQGTGRILIDAPYRNDFSHTAELNELFTLTRAWLEQQS